MVFPTILLAIMKPTGMLWGHPVAAVIIPAMVGPLWSPIFPYSIPKALLILAKVLKSNPNIKAQKSYKFFYDRLC